MGRIIGTAVAIVTVAPVTRRTAIAQSHPASDRAASNRDRQQSRRTRPGQFRATLTSDSHFSPRTANRRKPVVP